MAIDQLTASALRRLEGLPPIQHHKARASVKTVIVSSAVSSATSSSSSLSNTAPANNDQNKCGAAATTGATTTTRDATDSKPKRARKCRVIVDVSSCRYAVIKKCLRQRDFRLIKDHAECTKWDLWWSDRGDFLKELPRLNAFQKINHFPSMEEICRKDFLANNLNAMAKALPNEYNFFPRTFLLPAESVELQRCMDSGPKNATYIVKPRTQCQGKGIFLVQAFSKVPPKEPCVVQRYITNPLLVDGFKFDLRVYVLVYNVDPLQIHIFHNGLARFCTTEFKKPSKDNLDHMRMHLTNYAINKRSKNFQRTNDETKGSKRSICAVMKLLEAQGFDPKEIWARICDIVIKTLLAIENKLQSSYRSFFGQDSAKNRVFGPACFEILGFDVMLDDHGTPWLFEVNHAPSFAGDSPLDREIKSALISAALDLVNITNDRKKQFLMKNRQEWKKRLWSVQPPTSRVRKADDKKLADGPKAAVHSVDENQQKEQEKRLPPLESEEDDEEEPNEDQDENENDEDDDEGVDKQGVHDQDGKATGEGPSATHLMDDHNPQSEEDRMAGTGRRASSSVDDQHPPRTKIQPFSQFFFGKPTNRICPDPNNDSSKSQEVPAGTQSDADSAVTFDNVYSCIFPLAEPNGTTAFSKYYANIHKVAHIVNRSNLWS